MTVKGPVLILDALLSTNTHCPWEFCCPSTSPRHRVCYFSAAEWKTSEEGRGKKDKYKFSSHPWHIMLHYPRWWATQDCQWNQCDGDVKPAFQGTDAAFTNGTEAENNELWFGRIKYARKCKILCRRPQSADKVPKHRQFSSLDTPTDSMCSMVYKQKKHLF